MSKSVANGHRSCRAKFPYSINGVPGCVSVLRIACAGDAGSPLSHHPLRALSARGTCQTPTPKSLDLRKLDGQRLSGTIFLLPFLGPYCIMEAGFGGIRSRSFVLPDYRETVNGWASAGVSEAMERNKDLDGSDGRYVSQSVRCCVHSVSACSLGFRSRQPVPRLPTSVAPGTVRLDMLRQISYNVATRSAVRPSLDLRDGSTAAWKSPMAVAAAVKPKAGSGMCETKA